MNQPKDIIITVKTLAAKFQMKPIQTRRILRAEGIRPKKVEVPNGWPNQKRRQYVWNLNDPELKRILPLLMRESKTKAE